MSQHLTKERVRSHADLSADRNRNVSDRRAVAILRCFQFNPHEEKKGDQLINRDRGTVTDLTAALSPLTQPPHLKSKDKVVSTVHICCLIEFHFFPKHCHSPSFFVSTLEISPLLYSVLLTELDSFRYCLL